MVFKLFLTLKWRLLSFTHRSVGIMTQVWHYDTSVVLDGNSHRWQITVQAHKMKKERYTRVPIDKPHVHVVSQTKRHVWHTHTLSRKEKRVHVGKLSFGPWYLVHGIVIHGIGPRYLVWVVDPKYLVQGIDSKWFWTMVLSKA